MIWFWDEDTLGLREEEKITQFSSFSIFFPVHRPRSTSLLLGHVRDMCFVTRQ